jgi:hypothetical protein
MTDYLSPQSETWVRGFSLAPREPGLRLAAANVYREFARTAKTDAERVHCIEQAEKWSQP